MKMCILLFGIAVITTVINYSCYSSDGNAGNYEKHQEVKPVFFDGNFKGTINKINVSVSLKNDNGKITGTYKDPETNYSISGVVDASGNLAGNMDNGLLSFNCTGYYEGYNLILELDKDFMAVMRILVAATGNTEDAIAMESRLVLEKQ